MFSVVKILVVASLYPILTTLDVVTKRTGSAAVIIKGEPTLGRSAVAPNTTLFG